MRPHHVLLTYVAVLHLVGCASAPSHEPHEWTGRWEDHTGYSVKIKAQSGGYILRRSGGPAHLTFVGFSHGGRTFIYREQHYGGRLTYIHKLSFIADDQLDDKWTDPLTGAIIDKSLLYRAHRW